ncbi:hypothetical protein MNAN1_001347 [Malassezia nana]|uniref:U2 snRNP-associated SURP motif-containing protein n=1 Tax=Malassezia nana TaxID=180528 RepID=A0AAF0EIX7_9BASI|nr:hypothetical protein MNAN1_001347 [Malassezia nana]
MRDGSSRLPAPGVSRAFADDEPDEIPRPIKQPRHGPVSSFVASKQPHDTPSTSVRPEVPNVLEPPRADSSSTSELSTNLCVRPLPPLAHERSLGLFFAEWGAVARVDIRVSSSDDVRTGYVAFMERDEAERALAQADGRTWGGTRLQVAWAPAVPRPTVPAFRSRDAPRVRRRMAYRHRGQHAQPVADAHVDASFLDEGYASLYSTDSEEVSEAEASTTLGPLAAQRFKAMLRSLTLRRERIARCMMLALDHAQTADTLAAILANSLQIASTPIPRKLARLYVVSDILCNGAAPVPGAWKYREAFQTHLPTIFAHLGATVRACPGRITAEKVRRPILEVLDLPS